MRTSRLLPTRVAVAVVATASLAALTACGDNSDPLSSGGGSSDSDTNTIVVGSANFTESEIVANIYAEALQANGFDCEHQAEHRQPRGVRAGRQGRVDRPDSGLHRKSPAVPRSVRNRHPRRRRGRRAPGRARIGSGHLDACTRRGQGRRRGHQGDRRQVEPEVDRRPRAVLGSRSSSAGRPSSRSVSPACPV